MVNLKRSSWEHYSSSSSRRRLLTTESAFTKMPTARSRLVGHRGCVMDDWVRQVPETLIT